MMSMANIEKFKRINTILIKRGKFPKQWTPYIVEYYLQFEAKDNKQK